MDPKQQQLLSEVNAHPRDAQIRFEEDGHKYFIDGKSEGWTSTTTFIHSLFPHFNADKIISGMMRSKKWPESKYFGMTRQAIKDSWDQNGASAAALGTAMHLNLENYYNGLPHETESKEWQLFQLFKQDYPNLRAFRTEMTVWDEEVGICGSVDMIFCDPDEPGSYLIYDYKRSKAINYENTYAGGTHELTQELADVNFHHYSLQLYVYKQILETKYSMKINGCFLLVLHPDQESYLRIECKDVSKIVAALFQERRLKRLKAALPTIIEDESTVATAELSHTKKVKVN